MRDNTKLMPKNMKDFIAFVLFGFWPMANMVTIVVDFFDSGANSNDNNYVEIALAFPVIWLAEYMLVKKNVISIYPSQMYKIRHDNKISEWFVVIMILSYMGIFAVQGGLFLNSSETMYQNSLTTFAFIISFSAMLIKMLEDFALTKKQTVAS